MRVHEGSRFVRTLMGDTQRESSRTAPPAATSRLVHQVARADASAQLSAALDRLGTIVDNNETERPDDSSWPRAMKLPTSGPAAILGGGAKPESRKLREIASARPTVVVESPVSSSPAYEKLMPTRVPATAGIRKPELEVHLPSALPPIETGPVEKDLSVDFDPEMEDEFDHVWVSVQRQLSEADEFVETDEEEREVLRPNAQSLVVTSWSPDEGCSTMALGLAARAAASAIGGACLVDADFHEVSLTKAAGLEGRDGLAEVLRNEANLEDVLVNGLATNLSFLPAGRVVGPDSLADDAALRRLIRSLEEKFRYILYDVSSLKRGVEAYRWGRFVGNSILLIRAGTTRRHTVRHAIDSMRLHGMRVFGTVLNHRVDVIPNWLDPFV